MSKSVFVTVGTTNFDALVDQINTEACQKILQQKGFDRIVVQYGRGKSRVEVKCPGISVDSYDYKPSLHDDMQQASLIISHAGSGSIMEALKLQKPLLVVVNDTLMNNHQIELAKALGEKNHLVYSNPREMVEQLKSANFSKLTPLPDGNTAAFGRALDGLMKFS